jgi:hypothetical protein
VRFWKVCKLLILERETGLEPATSSLGSQASFESKITYAFLLRFPESVTPRRIRILGIPQTKRGTNETSVFHTQGHAPIAI